MLDDAEDDPAYEDEHEAIEHVAKEAGRGRFRWVLSCIDHRENDDRDENQKAEYRHENQGEAQGRRIEGSDKGGAQDGAKKITAPMPGKVVRVIAQPGTEVEQGAGVIVIEAMKMQNELKSPKKGRVVKVLAAEGAPVNAGDVLAVIE